jgi:hypothetical protein
MPGGSQRPSIRPLTLTRAPALFLRRQRLRQRGRAGKRQRPGRVIAERGLSARKPRHRFMSADSGELKAIAQAYRRFAAVEAHGASPAYERLALAGVRGARKQSESRRANCAG